MPALDDVVRVIRQDGSAYPPHGDAIGVCIVSVIRPRIVKRQNRSVSFLPAFTHPDYAIAKRKRA